MNVFDKVINECFDVTDSKTRKTLLSLNEADHDKILAALSNRLYGFIINKVADIDYGEIPNTKGDITKIPNYIEMMDCLSTIRDLVIQYKQPTTSIDTVINAVENIKATKQLWERAFGVKCECAMTMYNTYALSCVSATSLLITSSVEFVKDPSNKGFDIAIDKTGISKSKDRVLLKSLDSLNKSCKKQELQKAVDWMIKSSASLKEFSVITNEGIATVLAGVAIGATVLAAIPTIILPAIYAAVSYLYETRQSIADYFEAQSHIIRMNAENLAYNTAKSNEQIKKIQERQNKIADNFKKIANKMQVTVNTADKAASKAVKEAEDDKVKIDDLDTSDDNNDGSIF